jgi:hypothetical protein
MRLFLQSASQPITVRHFSGSDVCTKRPRSDISLVHTEQARLVKSLLYSIYRHLYLKQTRNA